MSTWPITVPQGLYDAIAAELGEPFADSYLWGATLTNGHLLPRTVTAWHKLSRFFAVTKALAKMNITLDKPEPFGSPNGSQRSYAEVAPEATPPRRNRRPDYDF